MSRMPPIAARGPIRIHRVYGLTDGELELIEPWRAAGFVEKALASEAR